MRVVVALLSLTLALGSPASAGSLDKLHYLVGSWKCTYRAGTMNIGYVAKFTYDLNGQALREVAFFTGGGADEELLAYEKHAGWTAVVFDGSGTTTIMRGTGEPYRIALHSVYPDAAIAEHIDRVSATEYTIHATVRSGGKTTASVDTCLRR